MIRRIFIIILLFGAYLNAETNQLAVIRVAKVPAKAIYVTQPKQEKNRLNYACTL